VPFPRAPHFFLSMNLSSDQTVKMAETLETITESKVSSNETLSLQPMKADFFARPSHVVAKELLGHRIVRKVILLRW